MNKKNFIFSLWELYYNKIRSNNVIHLLTKYFFIKNHEGNKKAYVRNPHMSSDPVRASNIATHTTLLNPFA